MGQKKYFKNVLNFIFWDWYFGIINSYSWKALWTISPRKFWALYLLHLLPKQLHHQFRSLRVVFFPPQDFCTTNQTSWNKIHFRLLSLCHPPHQSSLKTNARLTKWIWSLAQTWSIVISVARFNLKKKRKLMLLLYCSNLPHQDRMPLIVSPQTSAYPGKLKQKQALSHGFSSTLLCLWT